MKIIDRDITTITEGIIVHQVNTAGVMGAGVAVALANKFPNLKLDYYRHASLYDSRELMGTVYYFKVDKFLWIANLFAQNLSPLKPEFSDRKTSYDATVEGWNEISKCVDDISIAGVDLSVYMPYLMGCGLGGGNWNIYSAIVDEIMGPDTVTACRI